jgi:hypothetical protein
VATRARIPTDFRFWILRLGSGQVLDFRLSEKESCIQNRSIMLFPLIENRQSKIQNYLMTRSALANTFGGIVSPIRLAV